MKRHLFILCVVFILFIPAAALGTEKYPFVFSLRDVVSFNYKTAEYSSRDIKNDESYYKTDYSFGIDFQYFLTRNLSVGGIMSFNTMNNRAVKIIYNSETTDYYNKIEYMPAFSFGPVITWHFFLKSLIPFVELSTLYSLSRVEGEAPSIFAGPPSTHSYHWNLFSFNFQAGINWMVVPHVSIYLACRYTLQVEKITRVKASGDSPDPVLLFINDIRNNSYLNHDAGATLGFRFYL